MAKDKLHADDKSRYGAKLKGDGSQAYKAPVKQSEEAKESAAGADGDATLPPTTQKSTSQAKRKAPPA